jgi:hypothetical protein
MPFLSRRFNVIGLVVARSIQAHNMMGRMNRLFAESIDGHLHTAFLRSDYFLTSFTIA